jgi:hypothetical protein
MGRDEIEASVAVLLALAAASGTYLAAEAGGVFDEPSSRKSDDLVAEAA